MATDCTTYTYKTVGDCAIKADVYPPCVGERPSPVIVYLHGGCLIYGSRKGIHPVQCELYRRAGYAVVSIDYRLAPESKLPDIVQDLDDAFRWVHDAGPGLCGVDPRRLAVVGHSAGGYLALLAGCRVVPRPRAIVAFYGYGDIVGDWYSRPDPFYCRQGLVSEEESGRGTAGPAVSEPYEGRGKDRFYLYCRQRGLWPLEVGGRDPAQDPGFFVPYCPLRNVAADYPPTLLLHGDRDSDVPYEQSVLMARELARMQVPHELVTLPGKEHGFDGDMQAPWMKVTFGKVLDFLAINAEPRLSEDKSSRIRTIR
ncbi:MAG: Carboxylesterase NlhH [Lentisphaerae bacterium ADurb.BinA184]|nr:MAG: Carboxylesterase NlhH [Lentisphaerae bacterium ADurb.BinA184]